MKNSKNQLAAMWYRLKKPIALLLALFLAVSNAVTPAFAENSDLETVIVTGTYGQTEARKMLQMINDFRTGNDAWCRNMDNEIVPITGLEPLVYDYTLEQYAMQRAMEIAIYFAHERPNGTDWNTIGAKLNGENIAGGQTSAEEAFVTWQETDEDHGGQGHRRNMLGVDKNLEASNFKAVGIGHVIYNGCHYWVQNFSRNVINTTPVAANDSEASVPVEINKSFLKTCTVSASPNSINLKEDESAQQPTITAAISMEHVSEKYGENESWPNYTPCTVTVEKAWTSQNAGIASVSGGVVTGKSAGSTTLVTTALNQPLSVPVVVSAKACSTHDWDDGEITKAPTCTEDGEKTFTCTNCGETEPRTIEATGHTSEPVPGKEATCTEEGLTDGEKCSVCGAILKKQEVISALSHKWDDGEITKDATCTEEGEKTFTCTDCGETKTEPVKATSHISETVPGKEATCTEAGLTAGEKCSVCGTILKEQEVIPVTAHTSEPILGKEPTCTEAGLTDGAKCSVCGAVLKEQESISALGHDFGEWEEIDAPTCGEIGSKQRTCNRCGFKETEDGEPTGHDWNEDYTIDVKPTCTTDGSKSIHCKNCDAVKDSQSIPALGHKWDEGKVIQEATCTEDGKKTFTCERCGDTTNETIKATGHTGETVSGKEATCTEAGLTAGEKCSVCGAVLKEQESISALGHDFGEWEEIDAPTCGEIGSKQRTCNRCGFKETEDGEPTGHDWNEDYTIDVDPTCTTDGSKSIHCKNCDAVKDSQSIPALGHKWDEGKVIQEATCTENGKKTFTCERCGDTTNETIKATGHTGETVSGKEATCTEAGLTAGEKCSVCDAVLKEQESISALGHDFGEWEEIDAPTCGEISSKQRTCKRCGFKETEDGEPTDHDWNEDYTIDVDPTCTTDGSKSIHCKNCDAVKDSQSIPALGHKWDEGKVIQEATSTVEGIKRYTCTVCGETKDESIDKLPETPSKPSKPSKPCNPSKPSKPTQPSKPTEPSKPCNPSKPTEPSKPSKPAQSKTVITVSPDRFVYDGSAKMPAVTVTLNGKKVSRREYNVSYQNNVNAGTATVIVTDKKGGKYTVSGQATFTIVPASLTDENVTLSSSSVFFNKKEQTPAVMVQMNGSVLTNGVDYTVSYQNNVYVGTASVIVTGKGNYTGTVTKTFQIIKAKKKGSNSIVVKDKFLIKNKHGKKRTKIFALNASAKKSGSVLAYTSNSKLVKVNSKGVVTLSKKFHGKAVITITATNNRYKTVTKNVTIIVK